jgi:hypothetical protein
MKNGKGNKRLKSKQIQNIQMHKQSVKNHFYEEQLQKSKKNGILNSKLTNECSP